MVSAPMARTADSSAVGGRNSSGLSSAAVMLGRPPAVVIRSMRRVRPIIDAAALEMLTSERMGHEIPGMAGVYVAGVYASQPPRKPTAGTAQEPRRQKPRLSRAFTWGERGDSNPRHPGPQPGAHANKPAVQGHSCRSDPST